jgi:DNA-binding MarR family transcriptional regulator
LPNKGMQSRKNVNSQNSLLYRVPHSVTIATAMTPKHLLESILPTFAYPHFPVRSIGILLMLYLLDEQADLGEVAKLLRLGRPAMTRLMDGLSIKGFARRTRNEHDRRRVFLSITNEGRKFIARLCEAT